MKVPAGKYWLGDPCYCFDDHDFWCNEYLEGGLYKVGNGVFTVRGLVCAAFGTAYGDGTYPDQFGNMFPVDAGLIGLTPVQLVDKNPFGSILVEFTEDTEVSENDGVLTFGKYEIQTNDEIPYWEDEE